MPVKTIARPASSAAAMTSLSRIDPPGWIRAVAPALNRDSNASGGPLNAPPIRSIRKQPCSAVAAATTVAAVRQIRNALELEIDELSGLTLDLAEDQEGGAKPECEAGQRPGFQCCPGQLGDPAAL